MWSWQLLACAVYVPFFGCLWIVEMSFVFIYRKDFSSSYYIFFNVCGILSLINELIINFATRLPLFPEVNSFFGTVSCIRNGRLPSLLYAFGHFFGGAHETVNILISINRTTAIIVPRIHNTIWKFGIPISFVIAALIGAAGSWHLFVSTAHFYEFSNDGEIYYLMRPDYSRFPEVNDARNAVVVALVSPAISVPLYAISILFIRKKWKQQYFRTQAYLVLLGVSSVILSLPIAFHQLYIYIRETNVSRDEGMILYRMLPLLFDLRWTKRLINTCSNFHYIFFSPTLLVIITDTNMRRRLISTIGWTKRIYLLRLRTTMFSTPT